MLLFLYNVIFLVEGRVQNDLATSRTRFQIGSYRFAPEVSIGTEDVQGDERARHVLLWAMARLLHERRSIGSGVCILHGRGCETWSRGEMGSDLETRPVWRAETWGSHWLFTYPGIFLVDDQYRFSTRDPQFGGSLNDDSCRDLV